MVNNSTNINKNYLSLQLIEWWSTIPPISNHLSPQLIAWWSTIPPISTKSPLTSTHWVMVNNSININKHHLSFQLIEWWSTIPQPISTKITPLFNSLSDSQQFHQYQQKSPLTSIHWVMVNNSTNINKNHLSPKFIEWWSTIPPISTKIISHFNLLSDGQQFHQYQITSHLNSLSDGQQFHQYQQKSPLTSTHWVMVNNSTNISKHHLSP
jgi:predicted secreted protein